MSALYTKKMNRIEDALIETGREQLRAAIQVLSRGVRVFLKAMGNGIDLDATGVVLVACDLAEGSRGDDVRWVSKGDTSGGSGHLEFPRNAHKETLCGMCLYRIHPPSRYRSSTG